MNKERISMLCQRHPVIPAIASGIIIGAGARVLKLMVAAISRLATSGFRADHSNWWMIPLGVAAIVASGWIVRHIVKMPLEHSAQRLKHDLADGDTALPARLTVAPIAVSSLTLGLGGSAGSEGPIAYAGGAIASNLARLCGLQQRRVAVFLACGAGAGIAAIFKAPVGGMFFTIEVLGFSLAASELLLLGVMCLTAAMTALALGGFVADLAVASAPAFGAGDYLPACLLALCCGLYSVYYSATGTYTERKLRSVKRPWARNLAAGLTLGALLFMFPSVYGEGYGVLGRLLNGNVSVITEGTFAGRLPAPTLTAICLVCVLAIKGVATYATNSGGGVAGDFAPTIFAGGVAGALFAMGAAGAGIISEAAMANFVLLGMAGVMAGAVKAPLMAIFIVMEMTWSTNLTLPLSLVCAISYGTVRLIKFPKTNKHNSVA